MKKDRFLVGITFLSLLALSVAGCGSSSGGGGGGGGEGADDATVEASETDALDAGTAAEGAAFAAVTVAGGGDALVLGSGFDIAAIIKNAITITETTSCTEGGVPSPSGDLFDESFDGSVSGSCTVTADGTSTDLSLVADCTDFNDGDTTEDATFDGALGVEASIEINDDNSFDYELSIGSEDLVMTLSDGDNCSLDVNLTATIFVDNTGSGTVGIEGCVTLCGEGFEATGEETF